MRKEVFIKVDEENIPFSVDEIYLDGENVNLTIKDFFGTVLISVCCKYDLNFSVNNNYLYITFDYRLLRSVRNIDE